MHSSGPKDWLSTATRTSSNPTPSSNWHTCAPSLGTLGPVHLPSCGHIQHMCNMPRDLGNCLCLHPTTNTIDAYISHSRAQRVQCLVCQCLCTLPCPGAPGLVHPDYHHHCWHPHTPPGAQRLTQPVNASAAINDSIYQLRD